MTALIASTEQTIQLCTFWLNDCLFGINILDVKEVNSELNFTPIYHSSEKVCGYLNIRGNIHLVINMRKMMGFEDKKQHNDCRVVLFKPTVGESFGVLVDKVGDVVDIEIDLIENRRKSDEVVEVNDRKAGPELSLGVYKLDENLLVILNARNFLKSIRN